MEPILFTSALLKIASRCNLDCDYCYVYHHADQSWRNQPHFMSAATFHRFAERLDEYVALHTLEEFSVTFHGGEPLLRGADGIAEATRIIRSVVDTKCFLDFSLQTNGTLLTDDAIDQLEQADVLISLSIDGPRRVNDLHRVDHLGTSSFEATASAISRLRQRRSDNFRGIIAVIDPHSDARELFEFFQPLGLPRLDFLLPDATHVNGPPGRLNNPMLYVNWLRDAFDLWFNEFSSIPIRWFDAFLGTRIGVPSPTDAMGLGSVSLIVIDTDGTYTDHDVFKITTSSGPSLKCDLESASFEEVGGHDVIATHAFHLTLEGLAEECKVCPVVAGCGGGCVMHRWHPHRKLHSPSVYCGELFSTFESASRLLRRSLSDSRRSPDDAPFPLAGSDRLMACQRWRMATETRAEQVAHGIGLARNGNAAASILLLANRGVDACRQLSTEREPSFRWLNRVSVRSDGCLVQAFSDSIRGLSMESVAAICNRLDRATELLAEHDPLLPEAFGTLISDVVFVQSLMERVDEIFSFSDDSAPNVIYLSPFVSGRPLEPEDLADSLLHEFLHHMLYHLDHESPMLYDPVHPQFPAPWRSGLRPARGFFHGTFVFAGLSRFWGSLAQNRQSGMLYEKAIRNARQFHAQAEYGIKSLLQFGLLTPRGEAFLKVVARDLDLDEQKLIAPGLLNGTRGIER